MANILIAEEVYGRPLEFIPERWYSQPELIKHKNTFAAFGLGKCASSVQPG